MWVPALLLLPALLPPASNADPDRPCPSEMNKVKDLLEVNCTEQRLSQVPARLPDDTGILLLSINRFTSLSTADFLPLAQLQDLDLSRNALVALDTETPLLALRELILSHNELRELPTLRGLPSLTRLALAHNRLAALPPGAFQAVPRLQDLDLRGNHLRTLPQRTFEGLRALKDLDLSDNLLEELPAELLQDLRKLETFWLSGNLLRSLPSGFFPEGHIFMYVFLTENPWHCDCHLRYLRLWIRHNEDSVYQPERGLGKTKVEVAPEKVLCQSPPEHQRKPIIYFRPDCGTVGDADEEEEDDYGDGEEPMEKATTSPEESTAAPHGFTSPLLTTTAPTPSTPPSSTLAPSTRAPSPTPTPSTAAIPSSTLHSPTPLTTTPLTSTPLTTTTLTTTTLTTMPLTTTTLTSTTTSLTTTMSTTPLRTSSHPQTTLATSTFTTLTVSTGTVVTPTAVSSAVPEASTSVRAPSSPLTPTTPLGSSTLLSTHAPSPPATLGTMHFTHPAPSPSPAPVPLCPCSTQGPSVLVLRSQAGAEGPQWGWWVVRHCCLLHWGLYLTSLVLLVLMMLALAGCLAWMCLVGRPSWHKCRQTQEVQYPLLGLQEAAESPAAYLGSSQSHSQHHTFCTIREVELCPEVVYCTIKDLGIQGHPPAPASFRTTKELWVHHSPPQASFKSFSQNLMVTNLSSQRAPSAYSLDRGVKAMGSVTVKYAGNTL